MKDSNDVKTPALEPYGRTRKGSECLSPPALSSEGLGTGLPPEGSEIPADALLVDAVAGAGKRLPRRCGRDGCRAPSELLCYSTLDGREWCFSHPPDEAGKRRKDRAVSKGGDITRQKRIRFMPGTTPDPDWSSTKSIRAYLEQRAGMQERGELDGRAVPTELVKIAKGLLDTELLERLDGLEQLIRARVGTS